VAGRRRVEKPTMRLGLTLYKSKQKRFSRTFK